MTPPTFFNDFCFPKPWKIIKKSLPKSIKNLIKFCIDFWLIFDPLWLSKSTQKCPKSVQKSNKKSSIFWIDFLSIFAPFWAPTWHHFGTMLAPCSLNLASLGTTSSNLTNLGPTWSQLGQLGPNLEAKCRQNGSNLSSTWVNLGSKWMNFGQFWESFWFQNR